MHDPNTVAFELKNPFTKRYRPLVIIWHRDPEKGGDDDSCGWCSVNLSDEDHAWAESLAKEEHAFWFATEYARINLQGGSDLAIVAAAWSVARNRVSAKHRSVPLSAWDLGQVFSLLTSSADNFGHLVADAKQQGRDGVEGLEGLFAFTLRAYRTAQRKPWQHPRWHFWHWRVQIHPLQDFCRWAWSRCAGCGGRFRWGYAPCSNSWHGTGPQWFRGEKSVFHRECMHGRK